MERVQERALRDVYWDTKSSYDELLRKAKLTTPGCRRLQDIAIIMYKAKYNICSPYIKDMFKLDKPRYIYGIILYDKSENVLLTFFF